MYAIQDFNAYKKKLRIININDNNENLLDKIELRGEKLLLSKLEYYNKINNNENKVIRIYWTEESVKL